MVKVTGLGRFHFEECTPEDVIYQLDYNNSDKKNQEEYIQMFADCGWEFVGNFTDWSYFRKPAADASENEEIFCDDESRLELMKRIYKGRLLPLFVIFFATLMPQFILQLSVWENFFWAGVFGGIMLIYLVIFLLFAIKYRQFKDQLKK